MKTASVGDLRYKFKKVELMLQKGEVVLVTKRGKVIARLIPGDAADTPESTSKAAA